MIYLDNAATTQALPEVAEAVRRALCEDYANPSSLHRLGLAAERLVTAAREALARALGVGEDELVFTSGGTEANNLAIKGAARARAGRGRHLIVAAAEHDSVLRAAAALGREGFEVEHVPVDGSGLVDPDEVARRVRPDTTLVSVGLVNNETGAVAPLAAIRGRLLAFGREGPLLHADCVQALGKVDIPMAALDLASFSAHKIHGPKGVGALYVRRGVRLVPLADGGGQERGLRPGTENVPGIAGFGRAVEALGELRAAWPRMRRQKRLFLELAGKALAELVVNGPDPDDAAPHILNVSLPGLAGEVVVHALEEEGVFVSTGSACTSRDPRPSHVLLAMGLPAERAHGAVRVSLSRFTSDDEVASAAEALVRVARRLLPTFARRRAPSRPGAGR
ncbi:MAG: cysteine desulfurase [Clostridia bacterium]|nr:cysteine desulfurase [Clostridia bacterium]